jgi:hypothetical protein
LVFGVRSQVPEAVEVWSLICRLISIRADGSQGLGLCIKNQVVCTDELGRKVMPIRKVGGRSNGSPWAKEGE